jgi:hypothetical protein
MAAIHAYSTRSVDLLRPALNQTADDYFVGWPPPAGTDPTLLLCAELARLAYAGQAVAAAALARADLALAADGWIGGESLGERWRSRGTDGLVATRAGQLTIVAFRGTEPNKIEDFIADLRARPVVWPGGGRVHAGFLAAYQAVHAPLQAALDQLPSTGRLIFTGHSLGAAVATLAAAEFRARQPELVTFGSPRVGDAGFAELLQGLPVQRVVNCGDIVTRVPPARYTDADVADVLYGFLLDGLLCQGLARIVALSLRTLQNDPEFQHVGELHYIDRHQQLRPQPPSDAEMDADRQLARQNYSHTVAEHTLDLAQVPAGLGDKALEWLKDHLGLLLDVAALHSDQVPLRDLADHAPINYLAGLEARE